MTKTMAKKIVLKGIVQGVGMRYFIKEHAQRHGLLGYVKNAIDGSVQGFVQGDEKRIKNFIKSLRTQSPGNIEEMIIDDAPINRDLTRFSITF